MDELISNNTHEGKLSPEQISKADKDMATLSALSVYAASINGVLEVGGGYAVEAHFGGKMTRAHGDMDAVLWLIPDQEDQARKDVTYILFDEPTAWTELPNIKEREHFIEFVEGDPNQKDKSNRRIELYLYDKNRIRKNVESFLIDSQGKKHKILVAPIEIIVADKIRLLNRTEEQKRNKRETTQTDIDDFKRIISHPDFIKEKYLEVRVEALMEEKPELTEEQAMALADHQWHVAMHIINTFRSN